MELDWAVPGHGVILQWPPGGAALLLQGRADTCPLLVFVCMPNCMTDSSRTTVPDHGTPMPHGRKQSGCVKICVLSVPAQHLHAHRLTWHKLPEPAHVSNPLACPGGALSALVLLHTPSCHRALRKATPRSWCQMTWLRTGQPCSSAWMVLSHVLTCCTLSKWLER